MIHVLLATVASLAVLLLAFAPLERAFPARARQPFWRPGWRIDLTFFVGQYVVWSAAAVALLGVVHAQVAMHVPHLGLPTWARAVLAVVLGDLLVYGFHRACHAVPWLWRFHAVHHSAEHLDWLAAHREHPVDGVLTQLCQNLPAFCLGLSFESVAGLVALRGLWAIFVHSNVRLPLGPLRVLLGAPDLHHWHHARVASTKHNFANLAPWIDVLFGTYHRPRGAEDWALGLVDPWPKGYLAQLLEPFRRSPGGASDTSSPRDDIPPARGPTILEVDRIEEIPRGIKAG